MKTIQVTVERNFHCMNDDRFIMEKISMTAEVEDGDSPFEVINITRDSIVQNFKAAYPKVEHRINFDAVIQRDEKLWDEHVTKPAFEKQFNLKVPPEPPNHSNQELIAMQEKSEKTNKGTIEEQIQAYTDAEQLKKDWEVTVKGSKKYKAVYDLKLDQLCQTEIQKNNV